MLAWLISKITGEAIKAGGEVAKTATEIPKNIVETQKARREIQELDSKRRERERLITPATFEDVERYDPKVRRLHDLSASSVPCITPPAFKKGSFARTTLWTVLLLLFLLVMGLALILVR